MLRVILNVIIISNSTKEQPSEIKPVKLNITPNKKQETAPFQSIKLHY